VRPDWAVATIMTGFVTGIVTLFMARVALLWRRRDLPDATRGDAVLDAATNEASRKASPPPSRLGNFVTPTRSWR